MALVVSIAALTIAVTNRKPPCEIEYRKETCCGTEFEQVERQYVSQGWHIESKDVERLSAR
jgi:hypothetical protein